jgi:hypothetical protein
MFAFHNFLGNVINVKYVPVSDYHQAFPDAANSALPLLVRSSPIGLVRESIVWMLMFFLLSYECWCIFLLSDLPLKISCFFLQTNKFCPYYTLNSDENAIKLSHILNFTFVVFYFDPKNGNCTSIMDIDRICDSPYESIICSVFLRIIKWFFASNGLSPIDVKLEIGFCIFLSLYTLSGCGLHVTLLAVMVVVLTVDCTGYGIWILDYK